MCRPATFDKNRIDPSIVCRLWILDHGSAVKRDKLTTSLCRQKANCPKASARRPLRLSPRCSICVSTPPHDLQVPESPGSQDATPDRPSEQRKLKAESVLPSSPWRLWCVGNALFMPRRTGTQRRRAGMAGMADTGEQEGTRGNLCGPGCKNGTLIAAPKGRSEGFAVPLRHPAALALPHLCTPCMSPGLAVGAGEKWVEGCGECFACFCSATVESRNLPRLGQVRLVTWHRGKPEKYIKARRKQESIQPPSKDDDTSCHRHTHSCLLIL